jgi:hypothetical protein
MNVIGYRYHENDMHYFMLDFRREFQARESMLKVPVINNENKREYLYLEHDTFDNILYDGREYCLLKEEDYEVLKEIFSTLFAIESLK